MQANDYQGRDEARRQAYDGIVFEEMNGARFFTRAGATGRVLVTRWIADKATGLSSTDEIEAEILSGELRVVGKLDDGPGPKGDSEHVEFKAYRPAIDVAREIIAKCGWPVREGLAFERNVPPPAADWLGRVINAVRGETGAGAIVALREEPSASRHEALPVKTAILPGGATVRAGQRWDPGDTCPPGWADDDGLLVVKEIAGNVVSFTSGAKAHFDAMGSMRLVQDGPVVPGRHHHGPDERCPYCPPD